MSPGSRPIGTPIITSTPTSAITRPMTTSSLPTRCPAFYPRNPSYPPEPLPSASSALPQLDARKEVSQLERGRFRRIRSMRGVVLDRRPELLAQRSRIGFRRVGRPHERAPFLDRVRRLERKDDDGAGRHESGQAG